MTWDEFNAALKLNRKYGRRLLRVEPLDSHTLRAHYIHNDTEVKQRDFTILKGGDIQERKD